MSGNNDMRKGRIFRTTFHTEGSELYYDFFGRDENGDSFYLKVTGREPYFYVTGDREEVMNNPVASNYIEGYEKDVAVNMEGEALNRVMVEKPWYIRKVRKVFAKHWEADVDYDDRARYDAGIRAGVRFEPGKEVYELEELEPVNNKDVNVEPRTCVMDIEVLDDVDYFVKPEDSSKPVVSVSIYDSYFDKYVCYVVDEEDNYNPDAHEDMIHEHLQDADRDTDWETKVVTLSSEQELFDRLNNFLKKTKPDVITGWNFVKYDYKYLKNRAEKLDSPLSSGWLSAYEPFDVMRANDRMQRGKVRNKLDVQGERILGVGKLQTEQIHEMLDNGDVSKLVAYNLLDVIITKEIDEVKDCVDFHLSLSKLTGAMLSDTRFPSEMADSYFLFEVPDELALPSKEESGGRNYKGGYVEESVHGLFEDVAVLDFSSEYPRTIITFNLSPDTFMGDGLAGDHDFVESPNGNKYKKDEEGILPEILRQLLEERAQEKKLMREAKREDRHDDFNRHDQRQRVLNQFTNSFYGLMGSGGQTFRLANNKISEDITAFAREHIKWSSDKLEDWGYNVLYGDTDSIFFELKNSEYEDKIEEMNRLAEKLNESYAEFMEQYNGDRDRLELSIAKDKLFKTWFQPGVKKRYGGILEWKDVDMREKPMEDRFHEKGLEIGRANVSEITNMSQETVLMKRLKKREKDEIREYLEELKDKFFAGAYDGEMGIEGSLTKPPDEYKSKQAHVRAWEWANNNGFDLDVDDPFLWWYTEEDVAAVPLTYDGDVSPVIPDINYKKMWQRNVVKKIEKFIECMAGYYDFKTFMKGQEQKVLSEYM